MNNNNNYVYFHINLVSNEVFYVGKGKDKRAWSKTNRNQHWKNVVNKYGYRVDIIHENLSEKRAFEWEKLYISMFNRKNLVNLTDGGEGMSGFKFTDQQKQKLSDSHKGQKHSEERKQKISNSNKGRIVTEETREKLSQSNKGRIVTEETRKKMSDSQKGNQIWLGKKHSEETKEKFKDRICSEETKEKMSEAAKLRWQNKKNNLQLITE